MTDKKTAATATSATKKASVATKKPVTATPAAPKAEKVELTKKPAAATATATTTPAPAKPKAAAPSTKKTTSSLAKTSTKVTKKSTTTKGGAKKKHKAIKYYIDCTHPVEDGIFDLNAFERFLLEKMKINGKTSNLTGNVGVERAKSKISAHLYKHIANVCNGLFSVAVMSLALDRSNSAGSDHRIGSPGFARHNTGCPSSIYRPPELSAVDRRLPAAQKLVSKDQGDPLSSSSTSSIGKNSDDSTCAVGGDGEEVQSEHKRGPLDSLEALEEVLPIKKSISEFYCGKSKSYTSLSDAACLSMEDITKPENAYTRKRKNLLAFHNITDKNHNNISRSSKGGKSKRPNNSRSMLSLVAAMNCSELNSGETSYCSNSSPPCRPPLPPHARRTMHSEPSVFSPPGSFSAWRSFSLSDLQFAATAEASKSSVTGSFI